MEHVIFGFGMDIKIYPVIEILLYLIVYSLLIGITGQMTYRRRAHEQYAVLIRYGGYSIWWNHLVLEVLKLCFGLIVLLFGIGVIVVGTQKDTYTFSDWFMAFALWLTGGCTISLIQLFFVQFRNGYKFIFALLMCVEVSSLYFAKLPGSWLMIARSRMMVENGFSIFLLCLAQIVVIVVISVYGCYVHRIRRNYGIGN